MRKAQAVGEMPLTWALAVERVTGIEPALSAWEADVLPLNYTRMPRRPAGPVRRRKSSPESEGPRHERPTNRHQAADAGPARVAWCTRPAHFAGPWGWFVRC